MEIYVNLSIVIVLFLTVFGGAEFLYTKGAPPYITRKIVHIGGGMVSALLPFFVDLKTVVALGVVFTLILLVSKRSKLLGSIHDIEDHSMGAFLFPPGITLTALTFWPVNALIYQGSVLVLGLSDGVAGAIGHKYGKKTYSITGPKTIEGSGIFFIITFLVLSGILYAAGSASLNKIVITFVGSLLITATEAIFGRGWDNIFIPLVAGLVLYFIILY